MKKTLAFAGALALGAVGMLVAPASSASAAGGCHPDLPGVYRSVENGVPTYRQDARCGDTNRPPTPRTPQPRQPDGPCHDVIVGGDVIGELCGEGLRSNPYDVGGRVIVHGYTGGFGGFHGGGSVRIGTVTVGDPEPVDDKQSE